MHPLHLRDFAEEKPEQYRAFEKMAVRTLPAGIEVGLPNKFCLDKHVPDFLSCLQCWMRRHLPDSRRMHRLDLSDNGLSDESIARVIAVLRQDDVRVMRLILKGNRANAKGTQAITEYLWDCPEALLELDLSDNQITVGNGSEGNDPVSALLRCLYNHSAYPRRVAKHGPSPGGVRATARKDEEYDIEPLTLRLGNNQVGEPTSLLDLVRSKGGKEKVGLRSCPEAYTPTTQEFLSVYMPDFQKQRVAGGDAMSAGSTVTEASKPTKRETGASTATKKSDALNTASLMLAVQADKDVAAPDASDSESSSPDAEPGGPTSAEKLPVLACSAGDTAAVVASEAVAGTVEISDSSPDAEIPEASPDSANDVATDICDEEESGKSSSESAVEAMLLEAALREISVSGSPYHDPTNSDAAALAEASIARIAEPCSVIAEPCSVSAPPVATCAAELSSNESMSRKRRRSWSPSPEAGTGLPTHRYANVGRPLFLDGLEETALRLEIASKLASLFGPDCVAAPLFAKKAVQSLINGKVQRYIKDELAHKLSTESLRELTDWLLEHVAMLRR